MPAPIKLDEKLLTQLFRFENKTLDEISEIMNCNRHTIMRRKNKLGLVRAYEDKEWLIEQHIHNRKRLDEMAELANCSRETIRVNMRKFNIETNVYARKYQYDYDYFKNIDTPNKAYWLGFIVADGGIEISSSEDRSNYRLRILLSAKDDEHLKKFANEIAPNSEVKYGETKLNGKTFPNCYLSINSKKIVKDLLELGVYPNKSANEQIPNVPMIYMADFLRGQFDGDGCFSYWYNSRGNLQQELSFLGSEKIIDQIDDILKNILSVEGMKVKDGILYKLRFTKFNDILSILNWMYQGETYLERELEKINEWKQLRKQKGNSKWHPHVNIEDIV